MKKRNKLSRILALVLTMSLIFQQAGITTYADDGISEAAVIAEETEQAASETSEAAAASESAQAETSAPETQAETTAPETQAAQAETSAPETQAAQIETTAPETQAAQTETAAAQTDAAEKETTAAQTDAAEKETSAGQTDAENETSASETTAKDTTEAQTDAADESAADETGSEAVTEEETQTAAEGETEAASEEAAEAESETETETETETEAEAETELVAALEGSVVQTVENREIDGETRAVIRYTVRVTNTPEVVEVEASDASASDANAESTEAGENGAEAAEASASSADAADVTVKAVLPETGVLTLLADEATTAGLTQDPNQTTIVYWEQQTIAANTYKEYVFFALVDAAETADAAAAAGVDVTSTDALQADFYINDVQIPAENITWENTDLLTIEEEEGPTELVTYCNGVKITVTAEPGVLAAGTTLQATRVSASKVTDAIEELLDEEQELGDTVAFDIVLMSADGEEIQPDGLVTVSFSNVSFAEDAEAEDTELIVTHVTDDYATAMLMDTVDAETVSASAEADDVTAAAVAEADVAIETTHFSVYAVSVITKNGTKVIEGTYEATNSFSYTVTYEDESTYTFDSLAAFDFHIFALEADLNGLHTNGNIAVEILTAGTNFGTKNGLGEFTYIGTSASGITNIETCDTIVLGSDVYVYTNEGGQIQIGTGSSLMSQDVAANVYQVTADSTEAYLDIAAELEELKLLSAALAENGTSSGVTGTNGSGTITISDESDSVSYLNVTLAELLALADNENHLVISGIENKTLIINVDMTGATSEQLTKLGSLQAGVYGYSSSEAIVEYDCNLLWNFYERDTNGTISTYTTETTEYTAIGAYTNYFMGTILAPGANVIYGMLNGSVIAQKVKNEGGESHKWLYTGLSVSITVNKTVVADSGSGTFYFALYEDDGQGNKVRVSNQYIRSVTVSAGQTASVTFSNVTAGTKYYVYEVDASGNIVTTNYIDSSGVKWYVSGSGAEITASSDSSENVVTITNTTTESGSIEITKKVTVNGEPATDATTTKYLLDGTYTFVIKDGDTEVARTSITIQNGQSTTATVGGLEAGKTYTVEEVIPTDLSAKGIVCASPTSGSVSVTVSTGGTAEVEFTNNLAVEYGHLIIKKTVTAGGAALTESNKTVADGTYYFYIKDSKGNTVWEDLTLVISNGNMYNSNSASETVQLPAGTYYVYEDINKNTNKNMTLISSNGVQIEVVAGAATSELETAAFTNDYKDGLGSLKVQKLVEVNGKDAAGTTYADGTYSFVLKDENGNELDTFTIEVKDGTSDIVEFKNLLPGTYYVSEDTTSLPSGMTLTTPDTTTNNTGIKCVVTANNTADPETIPLASFTNNITVTGQLTIKKTVLVNETAIASWCQTEADGTYTFTIYDETGTDTITTVEIEVKDGVSTPATISLTPGTYRIVETGTPTDGASFLKAIDADGNDVADNDTTNGVLVEVEANNTASIPTVEFINNKTITGDLEISKTLGGNDPESDREFEFTIILPTTVSGIFSTVTYSSATDTTGTPGTITFTNGTTNTVSLKGGQRLVIKDLPAGISYTVTETAVSGYTTSVGGIVTNEATDTISESGSYAAFLNSRDTFGGFSVKKEVSGSGADSNKVFQFKVTLSEELNVTFNGVTFTNGVGYFTLTGGDTQTFTGIPSNITFMVEEVEANKGGYVTSWSISDGTVNKDLNDVETGVSGKISNNSAISVVCTNTREVGSLEISKTVEGNAASTTQSFKFTIELKDSAGNTVSGEYDIVYSGSSASASRGQTVKFENGVATIYLLHGESALISGILAGLTYTVTEEAVTGYETTVAVGTGSAQTTNTTTGTITADTETDVAFTNTKNTYGNLKIEKSVETNDLDFDEATEFSFKITLTDNMINGFLRGELCDKKTGDTNNTLVEFINGEATISLKKDQTLTILDLPNGVGYTVTETDYAAGDWEVLPADTSTGDIVGDETQTAAFTNVKEVGDLEISKTVAGNAGDSKKEPDSVKFKEFNQQKS
ncbi:MAG: DUF5979 domain-containing protein [Lachnospiraceae bacterium]|nr:DUF5979 domain-containing protein [Lachnospiraceae bacterium]